MYPRSVDKFKSDLVSIYHQLKLYKLYINTIESKRCQQWRKIICSPMSGNLRWLCGQNLCIWNLGNYRLQSRTSPTNIKAIITFNSIAFDIYCSSKVLITKWGKSQAAVKLSQNNNHYGVAGGWRKAACGWIVAVVHNNISLYCTVMKLKLRTLWCVTLGRSKAKARRAAISEYHINQIAWKHQTTITWYNLRLDFIVLSTYLL